MPATVAPEHFQTEQGFVASLAPKLSRSFEPTLGLPTSGLYRAAADGFACPASGSVIHACLMFVEVGHFFGHRLSRRSARHLRQRRFQLSNHLEGRLILELPNQRLEPRPIFFLVFAMERPSHRRQMLHGVIEVQTLPRLGKAVVGQSPDPHRAIPNDQRAGSLAQTPPQRFGMQLFAQGVYPLARRHKTALANHRPPTGSVPAMIQPKDGASVNPVPAFRLLALAAQYGTLAPAVPLPNIPGVHLNNHLIGFQGQFQLRLLGGGLPVQFRAHRLGAFALATSLPIQRGAGQFHTRKMFKHGAGILHGHFAGQQRGHFLHRRGIAGAFFQAQGGVGWHAPLAATLAVAARALDGNRAVAAFKGARLIGRQAGELLLANRTERRSGICLGLRSALHGRPEQVLNVSRCLNFEVAESLIAVQRATLDGMFQGATRASRQHGQRFAYRNTSGMGWGAISANRIHAPKLTPPCKKLRCALKKLGMDEKLEFCGEPRITYISNWNDNQISRKGVWGTVPLGSIRPAGNRNLVYASRAP